MENISVYKRIEKPGLRKGLQAGAILFFLAGLSGFAYIHFNPTMRESLFGVAICMFYLAWFGSLRVRDKYEIHSAHKLLVFYPSRKKINTDSIISVEIIRRKNGKIKRLVIRSAPNRLHKAVPFYKEDFLNELLRLNPAIRTKG